MTTLGPINSQNRVANYSANYRASPSLLSRSSAPVIHRVRRLSSLSADYLSPRLIADKIQPSGFFSSPPPSYPRHFVTRVWSDSVSVECGICKNKHRKHTGPWRTVPMHTIPRRVQELFGARPHHLYTTDRDTIENAWSTGSPVDSLTKRTGIRKAKVPLVHENRRLPSPRFSSLSLSVFSPFHFHFDKQELDDKAEAEYKNAQWNG